MSNESDPIAAMNALPDISGDDSAQLQGFMRMTATEIKAAGGVSAATSLEMIGYIRELERKLLATVKACSCCGEAKCNCGPYIEPGSKVIDDPCRVCGKCVNHCPHQ